MGFFKVYGAAFFTQEGVTLEQALAEQTSARLELYYARAVSVTDFIEGARYSLPQPLSADLQQAMNGLAACSAR